eukprot:CAMPEP_0172016574 /NCGR_PEP_ID=MMETSP1041-20130122/11096_1 /TAXON_ID=464988 /ORGANISM="Hemiselmis andersenii, Strain CCMP439" /LENGTH=123 /DNA_ID=CAMNT_0012671531 /DNA_START=1 /DNA_END=372 /DNA_ORIENTATION=-
MGLVGGRGAGSASLEGLDEELRGRVRARRTAMEYGARERVSNKAYQHRMNALKEKRMAQMYRKGRSSEKAPPANMFTDAVYKHWGGRRGPPPTELPETGKLCWELRVFDPVKRAYKDVEGIDI